MSEFINNADLEELNFGKGTLQKLDSEEGYYRVWTLSKNDSILEVTQEYSIDKVETSKYIEFNGEILKGVPALPSDIKILIKLM